MWLLGVFACHIQLNQVTSGGGRHGYYMRATWFMLLTKYGRKSVAAVQLWCSVLGGFTILLSLLVSLA